VFGRRRATDDNSPAFQRQEQFDVAKAPLGRLADGDVYPVLKRQAIVELSLWDMFVNLRLGMIPLALEFLLTIS
jgi:hypothetical protein